jgi:2-oxoglutarate dehydrogenase E1 component
MIKTTMAKDFEQTTFLAGSNAIYIEQLYATYLQQPNTIDPSWRQFFASLGDDARQVLKELEGASWGVKPEAAAPVVTTARPTEVAPEQMRQGIIDALRAQMLIRVYRVRGHLNANLDPLGLTHNKLHPELDPRTYGFTEQDYDRDIFLNGSLGLQSATLKEILRILQKTYCGKIGVEFMHIQDPAQKDWIQRKMENGMRTFSAAEKKSILESLIKAENFETFLSVKYPGAKRFGLEGGESMMPALDVMLQDAVGRGMIEVMLGMAHRGRLNVLINFMGMPPRKILSQFQGGKTGFEMHGSGDVKYHLGCSSDREIDGHDVHLSLLPNPSHLEAVNPVVLGKVRAKQERLNDTSYSKVMGLLIHGDAAFAGQGSVGESLTLSELAGYRTGGTLHLIINNQIGFTTAPHFGRSSPYCSDIAKSIQAPIFHVNGDDPEAVVWVSQMATEFKSEFKKDTVVDLYCYRRHGHNEMDEPAFTQPLMYQKIRDHESTRQIYAKRLQEEGVVDEAWVKASSDSYNAFLQAEFEAAKNGSINTADWLEGAWSKIDYKTDLQAIVKTGIAKKTYDEVAKAITSIPSEYNVHKRLARLLEEKQQALNKGKGIDWASAEALAFGSLLLEGFPVRLTGQDSGRGTFSQRHSVIYDQSSEKTYVPLNHISDNQAEIEIVDSPLAETSPLGFEYGFAMSDPDTLVIWEAQFGDFANGGQMIIDQFVVCGEVKWLRMSGLVMFLPHGYEGQGPEHTSARLERYLQLCAEDNMIVANCTVPSNFFHILRRQLHRNIRKPLIIMTPKSLLRHAMATSTVDEFTTGTYFRSVLPEVDTDIKEKNVNRVVLCTGKVYYDLYAKRQEQGIKDIALLRVEQIYPFPEQELAKELARYPSAEVVWCQEEPENMGSWLFLDRRIEQAMHLAKTKEKRPLYEGRPAAAATATGFASRHAKEQQELIDRALRIKKKKE